MDPLIKNGLIAYGFFLVLYFGYPKLSKYVLKKVHEIKKRNEVKKMNSKPKIKISSGTIVLTKWDNFNEANELFEIIKLERIFKNKDDKWQSTDSFRLKDLADIEILTNHLRRINRIRETKFE